MPIDKIAKKLSQLSAWVSIPIIILGWLFVYIALICVFPIAYQLLVSDGWDINKSFWNIGGKIWIVFSGIITIIPLYKISKQVGIGIANREYEEHKRKDNSCQ